MEVTLARLYREREQFLEEVSVPLVPVAPGVLVLPLIGSLDTTRMQYATDVALDKMTATRARAMIIDITGARIIDSHAVANLHNLIAAIKLIGAEAVVTGVTAHVAQNLVRLGVHFENIRTHRTLAEALAALEKRTKQ
jgi:rsbT co-antagonist protein RsbR